MTVLSIDVWSSCCAEEDEETKQRTAEMTEVVVASDQSLKSVASAAEVSTQESLLLTSVDVPSSGSTTKPEVQAFEPSTTEAPSIKIQRKTSKNRSDLDKHSTIEVTVDKSEHGPLGWIVDASNHRQLIIKDIEEKQSCEESAAAVHTKAAVYDWVKFVNGLPGTSTELSVMLQDNTRLNMQLLRPKIIDVRVEGDRKLGAVVQYTEDSLGCIIHEIHFDGLLAAWNSLNPSQLVKPMDRIISVNGIDASAPQLFAMLKQGCATALEVLSYP